MADAKQLKVKIHSTNNIKKITNALEIISTLKLQKVKKNTVHLRDCMLALVDMVASIDSYDHLFTQTSSSTSPKDLVIVIGTEKGLCGSLNTMLYKQVHATYGDQLDHVTIYAVGKKTKEYFSRRGYSISHTTLLGDEISHEMIHELLDVVAHARKKEAYASITICYNIFKNTMKYIPVMFPLFPLDSKKLTEFLGQMDQAGSPVGGTSANDNQLPPPPTRNRQHTTDLLIEPSITAIRQTVYAMLIDYVIYGSVLQNKTCEFASRMLAMKGAKDNATTQIKSLTLAFNKARQDAITREIIEVCGAKSVIE